MSSLNELLLQSLYIKPIIKYQWQLSSLHVLLLQSLYGYHHYMVISFRHHLNISNSSTHLNSVLQLQAVVLFKYTSHYLLFYKSKAKIGKVCKDQPLGYTIPVYQGNVSPLLANEMINEACHNLQIYLLT